MSQTIFTAKEAKNNFGRLLDEARRSPVTIKKNGRKIAFVMPYKVYSKDDIVDFYWGMMARMAMKEGTIGVAKSKKFLQSMLNA